MTGVEQRSREQESETEVTGLCKSKALTLSEVRSHEVLLSRVT